jgi:hypothetical protein
VWFTENVIAPKEPTRTQTHWPLVLGLMNPVLWTPLQMWPVRSLSGEIVLEKATQEPGSQSWHVVQMHGLSSWRTEDLLAVASQHLMSLVRLDWPWTSSWHAPTKVHHNGKEEPRTATDTHQLIRFSEVPSIHPTD